MISLTLTTWLHFGRDVPRVVLDYKPGPEIPGPVNALARAFKIALSGSSVPCEQCEHILPYGRISGDRWRNRAGPTARPACRRR